MIRLTRLNHQTLVVNSDLVKFIETAPDTVLTLISGDKLVVRETPNEVVERIVEFRRSIFKDQATFVPIAQLPFKTLDEPRDSRGDAGNTRTDRG